MNRQAVISTDENAADADELKPAFLEEGDPVEVPPFIMKSNIREMFGWQLGETLEQTIARKKAQG